MIQGATIRRASAIRIAAETTTIPASQSQAGTVTARARTAAIALTPGEATVRSTASRDKARFPDASRELFHVVYADLGRRFGDAPEDGIPDTLTARGLLERSSVCVRDARQVVLAAHVLARGVADISCPVGGELD